MNRRIWILLIAMMTLPQSDCWADGIFYRWVTSDGTVSYTDDLKRIPAAFVNEYTEAPSVPYKFTEVTEMDTGLEERLERLRKAFVLTPVVPAPECGAVTARQERRLVGNFNKNFFVVEDKCGVLYDAPQSPDLEVIR